MRILLLHAPCSISRDFIDSPYFADLGAVQLAAVLRAKGLQVTLLDALALPGASLTWRPDGRAHLGAPTAELLERARRAGPFDAAVVTYTPFHRPPRRDDVLGEVLAGLVPLLSGAPLLLADAYQSGQHYVEAEGREVLASYPEASAWVKYEAELTVPALLDAFAREGRRPTGTHRGAAPKLDDLPFPAWDLLELPAYFRFHQRVMQGLGRGPWAFPVDGRTLPVVTSRGCPYSCVHCSSNPGREPGAPKVQRRYGEARLREYLDFLVTTCGATRLEVLDELLNVDGAHFDALLSHLARLDARFDVPNGLRADGLQARHFAAMRGRVTTVSVSAESGVQRVLDEVVKKKLDLARVTQAARDAQAAGVPLLIHFIIGLPGETAAEVNGTLAYAMQLYDEHGAWPAVQYSTPLPGTALAKGAVHGERSRTIDAPSGPETPVHGERSRTIHAPSGPSTGSGRTELHSAGLAPDDWGPLFQHQPSQPGALVDAATLKRFKWTFDQRLDASRGPKKVIVNLTYVCNNHCTFCAVGTRTQLHGNPERQREHLERHRATGVTMLDIDGGEPTLHPELIPLIRYARHLGYQRVNVTTNGRLGVYEDFARRLVRSGLTTLLFSVHGPDAQSHAQQVGVPEAFEQTLAGIRNALKHKPAAVELGLNITLTRGNTARLPEVAQLAWDLGLRWMNVQFLTPFGRATRGLNPGTEQAAAVTREVITRWKDRMKFQVINLPFCFLPGFEPYLTGDLLKLERHMIFVNNEEVNLSKYLAERRVKRPVCEACPHAVFCGGFYELDSAPEPPWTFDEGRDDAPPQEREPL